MRTHKPSFFFASQAFSLCAPPPIPTHIPGPQEEEEEEEEQEEEEEDTTDPPVLAAGDGIHRARQQACSLV
jgi:hypothetical protein